MFQRKIDKTLKELLNVFSIADDILFLSYDRKTDQDNTLQRVLEIYRNENPKLNKDKHHFRFSFVPFFWSLI